MAFSEWKIDFEERECGKLSELSILPESARIYQERVIRKAREGKRVPMISYRSSVSLAEPVGRELEITLEMGNMV